MKNKYLSHVGILGMKWGHRKSSVETNTKSGSKQSERQKKATAGKMVVTNKLNGKNIKIEDIPNVKKEKGKKILITGLAILGGLKIVDMVATAVLVR